MTYGPYVTTYPELVIFSKKFCMQNLHAPDVPAARESYSRGRWVPSSRTCNFSKKRHRRPAPGVVPARGAGHWCCVNQSVAVAGRWCCANQSVAVAGRWCWQIRSLAVAGDWCWGRPRGHPPESPIVVRVRVSLRRSSGESHHLGL